MCGECEWLENKEIRHPIREKCDCGNTKWQLTSLPVQESLDPDNHFIYRCTKCDGLFSAPKFMRDLGGKLGLK